MVEQAQPNSFDDPNVRTKLLEEVAAYYLEGFSKETQLKRSLAAQFLNEQIFDEAFKHSSNPEELGEKIYTFLPNWKETYYWQGLSQAVAERIRIVKGLTYRDIADFSEGWYKQSLANLEKVTLDDPRYEKLKEDSISWNLVKDAAQRAVKLDLQK